MSMKINIDPVISSRIKAAWARLTPDQRAQIQPAIQSAHDQAALVAQTGKAPATSAAPHTLVFANTALTDDSSQVVSQLEAGVVVDVGPDGVIWGTGKWEQFDPGWAVSFAVYLESLIGGKHPWVATPQTIKINDSVQIAIAGDWGTGNWRTMPNPGASTRVGQQIARLNADITVHLGDVYYAGTSDEEQHLLTLLWPPGKAGSFTLNSNHEMYSGAKPYFAAIVNPPFNLQGGCSYFALENQKWVIVGLDSSYYSPDASLYMNGLLYPAGAPNDQIDFLANKAQDAQANGKRLILLSHHNGLNDTGTATNALFDQVAAVLPAGGPVYWYYGHEHLAAVYMPQGTAGLLCRCCGHGALPWGQSSDLATGTNVIWYENRNAGDPDIPQRVFNGFVMLKLDGPNIQEIFYDENGNVAWASS
jgi:Calcineurin-like phosphoesterase